jgi:hypothetical protein
LKVYASPSIKVELNIHLIACRGINVREQSA